MSLARARWAGEYQAAVRETSALATTEALDVLFAESLGPQQLVAAGRGVVARVERLEPAAEVARRDRGLLREPRDARSATART